MLSYNPSVLAKDLQTLFFQDVHSMQSDIWVDKVATIVDSDAVDEDYPFTGPPAQMEEVIDELAFTPLSDTTYKLTNKTFASGLAVRRTQIDDDQVGGIRMRIGQMASVATGHRNKIVSDLLRLGTTDLSYDGVSFFNDAHPARSAEGSTQDNLLAGSGVTTANFQTDLTTGLTTLMGFKGENGEPMIENPKRFAIVAPPGVMGSLKEALKSQEISNTSNVRFDGMAFDIILDPRLIDTNDWYLLYLGGGVKPLIFQNRDPLEFNALDTPTSSDVAFVREVYKYKARARYVGGYSYWQYAVKFVN